MAAPVVEATSSLPNALESVQQQVIQLPYKQILKLTPATFHPVPLSNQMDFIPLHPTPIFNKNTGTLKRKSISILHPRI